MKAWEELLEILERRLGSEAVATWLKPIRIAHFDAANITLSATPFQKAWFDEHVLPLKIPFLNNNQRPIRIHWETLNSKQEDKPATPTLRIRPDPLDPEFTLKTYLSTNEMGFRMAEELGQGSSPAFNPVVFFGPLGSGKTHLLTAIAHALQGKRVFMVSMQTFTDHVVNAIRLGLMQEFRKTYREIDVLIVDDIHELARKNATQEEFFHTFNTLHTLGRQIVLSSNRSPSELQEIEPRLISRFEWGIAIPLAARADLAAILEIKARHLHLDLSPDIYTFLQSRFSRTPKAAIDALHALALRSDRVLNRAHAETLLADLLAKEQTEILTHEKIIRRIADHFGIRPEDITGKSQTREFAQPRQIAMYFCRSLLNTPYQQLGRLFNRDHSTVISSVAQVETAAKAKQQPYAEAVALLTRVLGGFAP